MGECEVSALGWYMDTHIPDLVPGLLLPVLLFQALNISLGPAPLAIRMALGFVLWRGAECQ